jgi:outer membrane protein OmpA-like peptidoglycan-associated protein
MDKDEPAFNMQDGFYPSDGHILAGKKGSIYGTAEKKDALKDVAIHFCYLHESFTNDDQRNQIGRFWTLFIGQQDGVLASFAADLSLVFDRAAQNSRQPFMNAMIDKKDSKIEMHKIVRRELPTQTEMIKTEAAPANTPITPTPQPAAPALEVTESASELKINLGGDILFDFDRANIRHDAEPTLDQVLKLVQGYPNSSVLIDGYTDSKGSASYNVNLSGCRASAVKAWLVSKGIPEQNLWSRGNGADKPVASNTHEDGSDDPDGRKKNRRVEITIKK